MKLTIPALIFLLLLCNICFCQKTFYSSAEGDFFTTAYYIIGKVKNNIVIWKNSSGDFKKSRLIFLNEKMHVVNQVSTNALKVNDVYHFACINQQDSFKIIFQGFVDGNVVCKMATFDASGILKNNIILNSYKANNSLADSNALYQFISSNDKQKFALLKINSDDANNKLTVTYIYCNRSDIYKGSFLLPFSELTNGSFPCLLDDNNNLVLLESELDDSNYKIAAFKVNLLNNKQFNTIRILNQNTLLPGSLKILEDENKYFIYGQWTNPDVNLISKAPEKNTGVFCWQLNSNLEDEVADTMLSNEAAVGWYEKKLNFSKLQHVANITFSKVVFITGTPGLTDEQNNFPGINFTDPSMPSFSDMRAPANWQSFPNINGVYQSPTYYNDKLPSLTKTNQGTRGTNKLLYVKEKHDYTPNNIKLFNIDLNDAKEKDCQNCYSDSIQKEIFTILNKSLIVNSKNAVHILYSHFTGNNNSEKDEAYNYFLSSKRQLIYDIKLLPDGSIYKVPVMLMNLKYKVFIQRGEQVSSNTVIFPCLAGSKLAFAKVDFN